MPDSYQVGYLRDATGALVVSGPGGVPVGGGYKPTPKTAAYTALTGELVLADATGGAFTVTLPSAAVAGRQVIVKRMNTGVNNVTVAPAAGTIDGAANVALTAQYQVTRLIADGTNWVTV